MSEETVEVEVIEKREKVEYETTTAEIPKEYVDDLNEEDGEVIWDENLDELIFEAESVGRRDFRTEENGLVEMTVRMEGDEIFKSK